MEKLKDKAVMILVGLLLLGFWIHVGEYVPDNAIVFVDHRTKTYYGYTTGLEEKAFGHQLAKTTYRGALDRGYNVDKLSEARDEFVGDDKFLITYCLTKIGLLPDIRRWNADGTWNY